MKILMARRKKRLADNPWVENDGFIPFNSWINGSDWIFVVINSKITLWKLVIVAMKMYIFLGYANNLFGWV